MKTLLFTVVALAAAAFSGCVSTPMPPPDRRVTIAENLGQDIYVTDVRCTKGTGSYLTFQANVVNNRRVALPVEWRVVWLDADGVEIDSLVSSWRSLMIAAKDIAALNGTAPRPDAADMRFYVRRGRK